MRNKILSAAFVVGGLSTFILGGCSRDAIEDTTPKNVDFNNAAMVKFYNAVLGTNRTYIYMDGQPLNGATVAYGAAFPAHSSNYGVAILPGVHGFVVKDTARVTTQVPLNFPGNFQANTRYNVFLYDSINAPKQVTVETPMEIPTDTTSRLRLGNFWRTPAGVPPAVDVFSVRLNRNVFTNVQYTQVTDFVVYPSGQVDTFFVREAGTANLLAQVNTYSTTEKRGYSLILRGGFYTTSGTNIRSVNSLTEY